ncbi:hypothetical protein AB3X96_31100 [Paraburkholderia sp. BR13439]|uniref:hypothetical protein n=1 Tax=Paraburkholderia TaxID=1822464 RepID=UPI0034CD5EFB
MPGNKSAFRQLRHGAQGINRPQWSKVIPEVNQRLDAVLDCIARRLLKPEVLLEAGTADDRFDMALRMATLLYWKTVPLERREGHVIDKVALVHIAHEARRLINANARPSSRLEQERLDDLRRRISTLPQDARSFRKVPGNAEDTWNRLAAVFDEDDSVAIDFLRIDHQSRGYGLAAEGGFTSKLLTANDGVSVRVGPSAGFGMMHTDVERHDAESTFDGTHRKSVGPVKPRP